MGFLEVLTLVFVVCKLCGVITWSWWVVISPMYVYAVLVPALFAFIFLKGRN